MKHYRIDSVDAYNKFYGLTTYHPLVAAVDLKEAKYPVPAGTYEYRDVYAVFLKKGVQCAIKYGRQTYDLKLATYSEPFGEIAWELTGETDSVAGYQASAAIGEYGGRKWKVWFTEEIPVTFGPWKLAGLPGLVLQADDSEGLLGFRLIQFTKSEVPLAIAKNANVVKTERDKFIRQKNSNLQNPMEAINPASISSMTVLKSANKSPRFVINGVNVRMPVNTCIPLELK